MNTTLLLIVRVMQLRQLVVSIFSAKVMSQQFLIRFIVFFFYLMGYGGSCGNVESLQFIVRYHRS